MGREAMIRADMESVGTYSPIFDKSIKQLAKLERELARAEKTWRAAGGQMVAQLVNTTGGGDAVMAALVWAYLQGLDLRESAAAALRAGKATVEYPGTNNPDLGALVHG